MGLDMYLDKRTYVKHWDHNGDDNYEVKVTKGGEPTNIDPKKVKYIIEEAGYWRKANAIHKWFVDNCQNGVDDCRDAYVSTEDLQTLLDLCRIVIIDKSKAEQLLPSTSGFFFGNTEYDEWYYNDIQNTIEVLEKALEDKDADYYYSSSW
jgi:hypothetical protein